MVQVFFEVGVIGLDHRNAGGTRKSQRRRSAPEMAYGRAPAKRAAVAERAAGPTAARASACVDPPGPAARASSRHTQYPRVVGVSVLGTVVLRNHQRGLDADCGEVGTKSGDRGGHAVDAREIDVREQQHAHRRQAQASASPPAASSAPMRRPGHHVGRVVQSEHHPRQRDQGGHRHQHPAQCGEMGHGLPGKAHRVQRVARRKAVAVERRHGQIDAGMAYERPLAHQRGLEATIDAGGRSARWRP